MSFTPGLSTIGVIGNINERRLQDANYVTANVLVPNGATSANTSVLDLTQAQAWPVTERIWVNAMVNGANNTNTTNVLGFLQHTEANTDNTANTANWLNIPELNNQLLVVNNANLVQDNVILPPSCKRFIRMKMTAVANTDNTNLAGATFRLALYF